MEKISKFSEFLFPFLIKEIIKHRGAFFKTSTSTPKFEDLLSEGLAVLRILYPDVKWSTANLKFPILNKWLADMTPMDLETVIKANDELQKTVINTRNQDFKRNELLKELTNNGIPAANMEREGKYKNHIICETEPLLQIINNFYFNEQKLGKLEDKEFSQNSSLKALKSLGS